MKSVAGILGILFLFACTKTETPNLNPVQVLQEETIKFSISPDLTTNSLILNKDTLDLTITINSKIPTQGISYNIQINRIDTNLTVFKIDTNSTQSSINIQTTGLNIKANYTVKVTLTSKTLSSNTINQSYTIIRNRIYKNYLRSSYDLSNFDTWFSSNQLYKSDGSKYLNNPLIDQQSTQIDIDGDGYEDLYYYEGYDLKINPTPNPPPSIFKNNGINLMQTKWNGPNIKYNHGAKVMIGDFNNDSLPDIFSVVAVDQPIGVLYPLLNNNCHLVLNSKEGFNKVFETDILGYWHTGCSGDIDNDGDLDMIIFNQHQSPPIGNNVKNRILINDAKGNFSYNLSGIGGINGVYQSELSDINNDGFLDLALIYLSYDQNNIRNNNFKILLGNGKDFSLTNSIDISIPGNLDIQNIDFAEINSDDIKEIILSGYSSSQISGPINYYIKIFKSDDRGKTFSDQTSRYIENNNVNTRFYHLRVQDIDKNGQLDLFSSDKKDNLRWEWNGIKFIKK